MDKFETLPYKRSRIAYIVQCAVEYGVSLMLADAFLAKLLSYIGISDARIGIISSLISLFMIMELISLVLVKCRLGAKKMNLIFDTLSNVFFMAIYLIPFLNMGKTVKTWLVVLSIFIAYTFKYAINSIRFQWANSNVDPYKRARYSAVKEIVSLIFGMVFTAVTGYIIDRFEDIGSITGAFLFISISILVLNIFNFICFVLMKKEDSSPVKQDDAGVCEALGYIVKNRNVRNIILLSVLFQMSKFFTVGFMGTFKTKDLAYSVFAIQVINIVSSLLRAFISIPFGKFSDKRSYAIGMKLGMIIAAASYFINMFTVRQTRYFVIIYTVLLNISEAGTMQNFYNISFSYSDRKHLVQVMALRSSISGICGFGASLVAGKLLSVVQESDLTLFGIHIFGQQILSAVSLFLVVICILFIRNVIERQKITVQ